MIVFDCTKLKIVDRVLESVSQSTTNPKIKFKDEPKVGYSLPYTSAHRLIKNVGGTGRPLFDAPVQVLYHGDDILAVECADYETSDPDLRKIVNIQKNYRKLTSLTGEWFWDGQNVYRPSHSDVDVTANLKLVGYDVFDTHKAAKHMLEDHPMYGVQYTSEDGLNSHCTVPVLRRDSQMSYWLEHVKDLTRIDMLWNVNLRGVLYAASVLQGCDDVSFDQLEVLKLPQHMVELQTLSLVTVDSGIKWSTPAKMNATHMMVWMVGILSRVKRDITQVRKIATCFSRLFDETGKSARMGHFTEHYFETAGEGSKNKNTDIKVAIDIANSLPALDLSLGGE